MNNQNPFYALTGKQYYENSAILGTDDIRILYYIRKHDKKYGHKELVQKLKNINHISNRLTALDNFEYLSVVSSQDTGNKYSISIKGLNQLLSSRDRVLMMTKFLLSSVFIPILITLISSTVFYFVTSLS